MVKGAMEKVEAPWGREAENREGKESGRQGESREGLLLFEVRGSGKPASRFSECS